MTGDLPSTIKVITTTRRHCSSDANNINSIRISQAEKRRTENSSAATETPCKSIRCFACHYLLIRIHTISRKSIMITTSSRIDRPVHFPGPGSRTQANTEIDSDRFDSRTKSYCISVARDNYGQHHISSGLVRLPTASPSTSQPKLRLLPTPVSSVGS